MRAAKHMGPIDHALAPLYVLPPSIARDDELRDGLRAFGTRVEGLCGADLAVARSAAIDRLAELRPGLSEAACEQMIVDVMPGSAPAASSQLEPWPKPIELPGLPAVPTWSDALLPDALRPWLSDVAERTQCPPEYVAVGTIVALGSVIGRGCAIRPKCHDDWTVVPNLWGAVVGPPSAMKSPALHEAMRPVFALASEAAKQHEAQRFEQEALEAERKGIKAEMDRTARDGGDVYALRERYEAVESRAAAANTKRRYLVQDTSVESLGEILQASPRGVLLFRDELVGWLATLERAGHENDRAFYLEAWKGTGGYVYDRIGRGTVPIEAACVSIIGGIQPGPLGRYLRDAMGGGAGADGLMQRFQLAVFPDPPSSWTNVDRRPDSAARERANELYRRMAELTPEDVRADASDGIPFVRFDGEAQGFFDRWVTDLMLRARAGGEHEAVEGHLVKYASLMPSLALIFQLADHGRGPVALASAQRAAAWCELLEAHARRIYASVAAAQLIGARALLAKIRAGKLESPFSARDVYRAQWSGLSDPETVDSAITTLEQHRWVRRVMIPTGGRARSEVHVHPALAQWREAAE